MRRAYRRLMGPLAGACGRVFGDLLGPLRAPRHPLAAARFGLRACAPANGLANARFATERAEGCSPVLAAHAMLPLDQPDSAAVGLMLGLPAHAVGWPMPRGGSQRIAEALAAHIALARRRDRHRHAGRVARRAAAEHGGPARCHPAPGPSRSPATGCPAATGAALGRYRYGPGVFKVDWALDGPIPWRAESCGGAATVHVGGNARGDRRVRGRGLARPRIRSGRSCCSRSTSLFDPTRAPAASTPRGPTATCRSGSTVDMTERIEAQIERFAPGFRDLILARQRDHGHRRWSGTTPTTSAATSPAASQDMPAALHPAGSRLDPYATPARGALHLLVLDPARRRRSRHVRLLRGPGRAATRARR